MINTIKTDYNEVSRAERSLFIHSAISSHICPNCKSENCHFYKDSFICFNCKHKQNLKFSNSNEKEIPKNLNFDSNSDLINHLIQLNYPIKSINSMLKCGTLTGINLCRKCDCGSEIIPLSHHCNLRTCKECSKIRQRRILRQYLPLIKSFTLNPHSSENLLFLHISPDNFNDEKGLSTIRKDFSKFLRLDYVKDRVKGGLVVLEAKTKNEDGEYKGWNIHLHGILYSRRLDNRIRGKCLDCGQNLIKQDQVTKKYFCANKNCNSQNIIALKDSKLVQLWKSSSGRNVHIWINRITSYGGALNYVLKYVSANKEDFSSDLDQARYIKQTHKCKLINTFGCFYGEKARLILKTKVPIICKHCLKEIEFIIDQQIFAFNYQNPPPDNMRIKEVQELFV
ncbi:MAG: hypothetical protein ACP5OG_01670 [Candidatus Nanoarchaeia archaeon]